jgi:putative PIN family toxin of toxin-antitoxin system
MLKIVVDTNILVSSFLKSNSQPALIISLIIQKELQLCLSPDIFNEYQEVLRYGKFKHLDRELVKSLLNQLQKNALWVIPNVSVNIIKNHPADNKFLDCAREVKADFLITGNTRHFSFKSFHNTHILNPSEFLYIIAKKSSQ